MKIVATTQLVVQTMVVWCGLCVMGSVIYIMDIKKKVYYWCIGALVHWGIGAWGANLQEITQIEITSAR